LYVEGEVQIGTVLLYVAGLNYVSWSLVKSGFYTNSGDKRNLAQGLSKAAFQKRTLLPFDTFQVIIYVQSRIRSRDCLDLNESSTNL